MGVWRLACEGNLCLTRHLSLSLWLRLRVRVLLHHGGDGGGVGGGLLLHPIVSVVLFAEVCFHLMNKEHKGEGRWGVRESVIE